MSLLDDLKTFLVALALGVALTVSINYVVVNYTEGSAPDQAASQPEPYGSDASYETPNPVQKADTGAPSYNAYY